MSRPSPMNSARSTRDPDLPAKELKAEIKEFAKLIAWFLVLFLVVKTYVIEAYEVQGPSMRPTLDTGERILVLKLPHYLSQWRVFSGLDAIQPGDIIVFDSPDDAGKRYVKRVLAEGPPRRRDNTVGAEQNGVRMGEQPVSVRIEEGRIYVNNQRIETDHLRQEDLDATDNAPEVLLGPGEYYVVGDNFHRSKDSRSFRAVQEDRIIGKAVLRFWPLSKFGFVR